MMYASSNAKTNNNNNNNNNNIAKRDVLLRQKKRRGVRKLTIVFVILALVILDVKYADIHGRVSRRFKRDQRYSPSESVKSACRASVFREFRPAPVTSVVSRINEKRGGGKLECNLDAGLSIGYNCERWWNPMARNRFYMFFTLDPEIDVYVSRHMLQNNGIFDEHVHAALGTALHGKPICDSKNPILDVGSNLGSLTLAAASRFGCVVHAFEMQKDIACRVRMSASSNAFDELISVHNVAVSSMDGQEKSYTTNERNPGGTGVVDVVEAGLSGDETSNIVSTVTLDSLFYGKVESIPFVKIDTEGHEHEVLKSAKLLLSQNIIKHLVVEIRRHQTQMVNFLYENRFTCHLLDYEKKSTFWNANPKCESGEKLDALLSKITRIKLFSDLFCCHE